MRGILCIINAPVKKVKMLKAKQLTESLCTLTELFAVH